MVADYIKNDQVIVGFIVVGILIRYLPQVYYDIVNRKKKVLLKGKTVTKAWYIFILYFFIFVGFLVRFGCYPNSISVLICGSLIFTVGVTIGLVGLRSLNKQYAEGLLRYEGGFLVTDGIYSIVRHPMRIGLFIELLGMVILADRSLLLLPLIGVLALQHVRTKDEELMLKEFFGEAATKYMSAVPKLNFMYGLYRAFKNHQVRSRLLKTA